MIENISVSLEKHSERRDAARQLVSTLVVRECMCACVCTRVALDLWKSLYIKSQSKLKSNELFLGPLATFPENAIKTTRVFLCYFTSKQTNKQTDGQTKASCCVTSSLGGGSYGVPVTRERFP